MPYSDTVKARLLASIDELATDPERYTVDPGRDFSRNRKLGIKKLLRMLLTMEADSIKEELYRYFGRTTDAPFEAAFYKQRKKLKDDALRELLLSFTQKCEECLSKGRYSLVACDGAAADIFRDPMDPSTFFGPSGKPTKGFDQIYLNAAFSILDKRYTDLVVQPARERDEYSAFCQMIDRTQTDVPTIYICDRGHVSYNNLAHVVEKGQYSLIRCTDVRTERLLGFSLDGVRELDYHVDRILSRSQSVKERLHPELADRYRYVCPDVPMDYITEDCPEDSLSLRVVRIEIAKGVYEDLITNLPDIDSDIHDSKDLYHLRWDEETSFRDLKYPLCLTAFHSKKYAYIVQEVWVRAVLYDFCSEISMHVEIPKKDRKHVYKVNFAQAIKICRDFLRIHDKTTTLDVEGLIAQDIEPVRPGRAFPRQKRFRLPMSSCYRN